MSDAPAIESPRLKHRVTIDDTVTVGCKLPNGLILQLDHMEKLTEAVPGGFKEVSQSIREPDRWVLNGAAMTPAMVMSGDVPYLIVHGAALTPGIPKEFWERWLKANAHTAIVKRRMVFAAHDDLDVRAIAREVVNERTGLEPLPTAPDALRNRLGGTPMRIERQTDE